MNQSQSSRQPSPQLPPAFKLDMRAKESMKWSAIANAAASFINQIFSYISLFFVGGIAGDFMKLGRMFNVRPEFSVGDFVTELFWAAIWGAIGGFILSKFYSTFQEWNRKYLKGKLNTFFKLLFYPTVAGTLIGLILGGALAFITGVLSVLIIVAGVIIARYVYAKMMAKSVGKFYV